MEMGGGKVRNLQSERPIIRFQRVLYFPREIGIFRTAICYAKVSHTLMGGLSLEIFIKQGYQRSPNFSPRGPHHIYMWPKLLLTIGYNRGLSPINGKVKHV